MNLSMMEAFELNAMAFIFGCWTGATIVVFIWDWSNRNRGGGSGT